MKKLYYVIVNMMVFWVFANAMPGLDSPHGPIGLLICGLLYGVLIAYLPNILKFFKFPVSFWGKLLIGTLLTLIFLVLMQYLVTGILSFGPGYIGESDFIIFMIPKLITIPTAMGVIIFSSVVLNLCSIILAQMGKKD